MSNGGTAIAVNPQGATEESSDHSKLQGMVLGMLNAKRLNYKKTKLTRYFSHHKGRIFFIILCIIILLICVFTQFPIDGSINTDTTLSKFMSLLGYISSSIFMALLLSVLTVETYLSREELNKIDEELTQNLKNKLYELKGKIPDNISKWFKGPYRRLKALLNARIRIGSSAEGGTDLFYGSNFNIEPQEYKDIIQYIPSLSFSEKGELLDLIIQQKSVSSDQQNSDSSV